MNLEEYSSYDATGLANLICKGDVTAMELAVLAAEGVKKVNPQINAITDFYCERIERIDEEANLSGVFKGVPFFTKSIGSSEKGKLCQMGSRLMSGRLGDSNDYLVSRFKASGLHILGQTTAPEMGASITSESLLTGVTRNPWNLERIPGGSSSGAGALVAAGVVPLAHASDAGGSTRIPASCNGLIGLKCSRGRVSLGPDSCDLVSITASQFAVTKSIRDTATLLDCVQGTYPGESILCSSPKKTFFDEIGLPTGKLRIAFCNVAWHERGIHKDVKEQIDAVANSLKGLGHEIIEAKPTIDFAELYRVFTDQFCVTAATFFDVFAALVQREITEDFIEPVTLKMYQKGKTLKATDYVNSLAIINKIARQLGAFFEKYDLLLTPVLAEPVPKLGQYQLSNKSLGAEEFLDHLFGCAQYTPLSNLAGSPAISLPLCKTPDGMPMGAQFMAPIGEEARLIRFSAILEKELAWNTGSPSVHVSR